MNKIDCPLITISISCYNSADTVADAIESALAQDWPNLEILVADDGSVDDTPDIIRQKLAGHTNARALIYGHNKGFAGSLNTLIGEAKGAFFAIFDDDDKSAPDRVRRQYERIVAYEAAQNTDKVLCHAARTQNFQNGYKRYEPTMGTNDGIAPYGDDVIDRILTGRMSPHIIGSCANCSRMARIDVFRSLQGYDGDMTRGEDTEFNIRFARTGGHFVGIAEPLVVQTMTMGQEKTLDREKEAELYVINKHQDYLRQKGWYDFCLLWLEIRHTYLRGAKLRTVFALIKLALKHPVRVAQKLLWALPAQGTRHDFKKWHNAQLNAQDN
jgi:glycosyltransferase involved in cell wall biosynthesis